MKSYSALVQVNGWLYIKHGFFPNKESFIRGLRYKEYQVNPKYVKESRLFDYILLNCVHNDKIWKLRSIPKEEAQE